MYLAIDKVKEKRMIFLNLFIWINYFYEQLNKTSCTSDSEVKNLPGNARDMSSIPGFRRSPGEGNGNPLQYSCLGNPMNRGAWWATVYGVAKIIRYDLVTKQQQKKRGKVTHTKQHLWRVWDLTFCNTLEGAGVWILPCHCAIQELGQYLEPQVKTGARRESRYTIWELFPETK